MKRFLKLTFYRADKKYGPASAGPTVKGFLVRADTIAMLVPYPHSTKIRLQCGHEFEVSESIQEILTMKKEKDTL